MLEKFSIELDVLPGEDLDACFCGIHPAEARELRKMDDEALRSLHLPATYPSVLAMSSKHYLIAVL